MARAALCWVALLPLLVTGIGCMPEFEEEWLVKDLRILGIRAEPPEVALDPDKPPRITVDALVANPAAPPDRLYDWELWVCTPDVKLCDKAEMQTLLRKDRTPLEGIRHSFLLSDQLRLAVLEMFGKWRDRAKKLGSTHGMQRFPLKLELRVHQDPGPVVRGVKQVYLAASEPNDNPKLEKIEVGGRPLTDPIEVSCQPHPRLLGLSLEVADPPEGTSDEGAMHSFSVYISRRWFTFSSEADLRVNWSPCPGPGDGPGDIAYLWVVLRDGRGGIDWRTVRADTSK